MAVVVVVPEVEAEAGTGSVMEGDGGCTGGCGVDT